MKVQIRQGVFETNSSSTHSLQLVTGNIDNAMAYVNERILEAYGSRPNADYFDISNYMTIVSSNPVTYDIYINGIDFEDGDENAHAYAILKNWMAKLQYIGMLLHAYKTDEPVNKQFWIDFEKKWGTNSWNENYGVNPDYMDDLNKAPEFFESKTVEIFKAWVKQHIESVQGINVRNVYFTESTLKHEVSIEADNNYLLGGDILSDTDALLELFNQLMNEDKIMIYADEAYSPYMAPIIKIY